MKRKTFNYLLQQFMNAGSLLIVNIIIRLYRVYLEVVNNINVKTFLTFFKRFVFCQRFFIYSFFV